MAGDEVAQLAVDLVAHRADLAAQGCQPRARVLAHLTPAVEGALDPLEQRLEVRQLPRQSRQGRAGRNGLQDARRRGAGGLPQIGQPYQIDPFERRPAARQPLDQLAQRHLEIRHQPPLADETGRLLE